MTEQTFPVVCEGEVPIESPEPQFYAKWFLHDVTLEFWNAATPTLRGRIVGVSFMKDILELERSTDGELIVIQLMLIRKASVTNHYPD